MQKLVKGKSYCILWIDTFNQNTWEEEEDIKDLALKSKDYIKTVGYFVGSFGQFTCLAASHSSNPRMKEWSCIVYIPSRSITGIKRV